MPRFSIVIPTLQRPDTLRHALATALAQTCDDVEIIVQNNGRDRATEALVGELGDPRLRHCWSESVLTMTESWEAALAHAGGDLVTFIGDDDGLFPDACRVAGEIVERAGVEIVSWLPFCYYWPRYVHEELRNRLVATVDYRSYVQRVSSADELARFYRFAIDYSRLPMIYNSFVSRSVIERVRGALGRYFLGRAPDVTSGIVDAAFTGEFARLSKPLSMTGLSQHSTGHTGFLSARGLVPADRLERDFGSICCDERLVPSDNLQIFLANDMLLVRDRVPAMQSIGLDVYRLIQSIARAINDRPGSYADTVAVIRALAARHGIDLADIAIPAPTTGGRSMAPAATAVASDRVRFVIDGDAVRLAHIADAVRLMTQLVPAWDDIAALEIRAEDGHDRAVVRRGETLTFGSGGNGVRGLFEGWSEPEAWGTWSIGRRASIRLSIQAVDGAPIDAVLQYRPFLHANWPRIAVACGIAGQEIAAWSCSRGATVRAQPLTIPRHLVSTDGAVELELAISDPCSPASLGLSADTRLLGIGIEALRL